MINLAEEYKNNKDKIKLLEEEVIKLKEMRDNLEGQYDIIDLAIEWYTTQLKFLKKIFLNE